MTQLDRDDRLVRNPHTRADVPALKLRLTSSGFLIKIPPLKKEKEIIEIMSSDVESDDMPSSAGGVVHYDSDATVPSSVPPPTLGVCRPGQSIENVGPGGGYTVPSGTYGVVGRDPPGPSAAARSMHGALPHGVVREYQG